MADSHQSPANKSGQSLLSPARIAMIVFILVALVVIVYELNERRSFGRSFEHLNAAFVQAEAESQAGIQKSDFNELLSGNPSRTPRAEDNSELLTWNGILQRYRMRVFYRGDMIVRYEQE